MRRLLPTVLLLAFALVASSVRADDAAESRFFDRVGRRAYAARHWDEALEAFLRAQRVAPSARGLYNVALTAELAREPSLAFASYEELLRREDVPPELRTDAERRQRALARRLALLRVISDPPGATIYIDDRDQGTYGTTPATVAVSAGTHEIELVLGNHAPARSPVVLRVGEVMDAQLTLSPLRGRLLVASEPAGASLVLVRGTTELAIAPGASVEVPAGTYTLRGRAPGFDEATLEVTVNAEREERRSLVLVPTPVAAGRLLVSTGTIPARLSIDGEFRTETPARLDLPIGTHQVRVVADGFAAWDAEVSIEEGAPIYLPVTLVPE